MALNKLITTWFPRPVYPSGYRTELVEPSASQGQEIALVRPVSCCCDEAVRADEGGTEDSTLGEEVATGLGEVW